MPPAPSGRRRRAHRPAPQQRVLAQQPPSRCRSDARGEPELVAGQSLDMTALGKLLRTTAFKLSLAYLAVFALFAAFLLGYFAWNTHRLITAQITQTVDAEITGLAEQYRQ